MFLGTDNRVRARFFANVGERCRKALQKEKNCVSFPRKFRSNPMVRLSKVTRMRSVSFKRPSAPAKKSGAKKQNQPFKEHKNAFEGELATRAFLPKIQ